MNPSNQPPDWSDLAANLDRQPLLQIGAEEVAGDGNPIATVNAANGDPGFTYLGAGDQQVDAAIACARNPEQGARWWALPAPARSECLQKLADLISENARKLALHDSLDVGKPISAAQMEPHIAASMCRYFGQLADKLPSGRLAPSDPGSSAWHVRRPRGVVAAIVPWNYPLINATLKLAPALAAGNSVILKPSELSPGSAGELVKLCHEAGIPPGTVSCLPGDGTTGSALARHAGVDLISFTGSTHTGRKLLQAAADNALKPLMLECGGKSPELIFEDVSQLGIEAVAMAVVMGCMQNQGQLCVARSRLFVERSIYPQMVEAVSSIMAQMIPADPLRPDTQFGPLASPNQIKRIAALVDTGIADGAALVVDGRKYATAPSKGCYFGPTLFTEVTSEMAIMKEEIFGPMLLMAPFESEEHAVTLANDTDYGLAATAWTTNLGRAHRLMQRIHTGNLQIRATAEQRFGAGWGREGEPCGQSGFGVEGGQLGVESYTRVQSIQVDFPLG